MRDSPVPLVISFWITHAINGAVNSVPLVTRTCPFVTCRGGGGGGGVAQSHNLLDGTTAVLPHKSWARWRGGGGGGGNNNNNNKNNNKMSTRHAMQTKESTAIINLQQPHETDSTPVEKLALLAEECQTLEITEMDVYGDFDKDEQTSYLCRFEKHVADTFGKPDAVFMPSGVMAQSIALLLHSSSSSLSRNDSSSPSSSASSSRGAFACHHSSHLLLHEEEAYRALLGMEAIVLRTDTEVHRAALPEADCSPTAAKWMGIPPLTFADVLQQEELLDKIHTLLLELPHRELGGKLTPWQDVVQMSAWCQRHGIALHCDGARIFEASAGYGLSLSEMATVFDSVYISFYKGLGALSGAMLLGSLEFCAGARTWLRRFGGNLYTWLPLAVSCWSGFQRHYPLETTKKDTPSSTCLSFEQRLWKLQQVVALLSADSLVSPMVTFDPPIPETNMVHGYLRASLAACLEARDKVQRETGICVLSRVRSTSRGDDEPPPTHGAKFEWTMGDANGVVDNDIFVTAWRQFAQELCQSNGERE